MYRRILTVASIVIFVGSPFVFLNSLVKADVGKVQNVSLTGTIEGIDVRWDEQGNSLYWIAYQAVGRSTFADSWAYMSTGASPHLIRHLAGGYEYRVFVRGCIASECSEWVGGGTTWTEKPQTPTYTVVQEPTPTPTVTPRPNPTPHIVTATPTTTPTPQPATLMLSCPVRLNGEAHPTGREISEGTAKNFDVSFRNPDKSEWTYGVKIAEKKHTQAGTYLGIHFIVTESGEWQLHLDPEFKSYIATSVVDSGYFDQHGISFNYSSGALNTITFYARTYDEPYRFYMNGVEVPVKLPKWYAGSWPEHFTSAEYSPTRKYFLRTLTGRVEYTNLCMRNAFIR